MGLERRVKARREEEWEPELSASDNDDSAEEVSEEGDDSGEEDEDLEEAESGSEVCGFDLKKESFFSKKSTILTFELFIV